MTDDEIHHGALLSPILHQKPCWSLSKTGRLKMKFYVVEKLNPLAVHAICDLKERAQHWIDTNAVQYCELGYFMDKTLTPDSFKIIEKE
jgi:hypothetical protein